MSRTTWISSCMFYQSGHQQPDILQISFSWIYFVSMRRYLQIRNAKWMLATFTWSFSLDSHPVALQIRSCLSRLPWLQSSSDQLNVNECVSTLVSCQVDTVRVNAGCCQADTVRMNAGCCQADTVRVNAGCC